MASVPKSVSGDLLGLDFPPTIERLEEMGTEFLTGAFQAAGVLSKNNRVRDIKLFKEFAGGGMGRKLWLSVEYGEPAPELHRDLFVKFPRDFGDPLRELFGPLMEPEVRFALLSRRPDFPIRVPKCYFADYCSQTTTGILITERIHYGSDGIEPCHDKCMDYTLHDALGHYRAMTSTMARLAAHHKAGKFGAETDRQFPFDPKKIDMGARIPYTPEQLQGKLEKLMTFSAEHASLFPDGLGDRSFLEQFAADAPLVLQHEILIRSHLNEKTAYVALCHWNMNLDNAWFWRDERGALQAGLLDWGSVAQMNVAQAFYGMTCAAETEFLNQHRRDLMRLFIEEYRKHGAVAVDVDELAFLYKLSVAVLGIAWILDAPTLVEKQIPDISSVTGRFDPKLEDDFLARAQMQLLIVFLNEWRAEDIGGALRDFVRHQRT